LDIIEGSHGDEVDLQSPASLPKSWGSGDVDDVVWRGRCREAEVELELVQSLDLKHVTAFEICRTSINRRTLTIRHKRR